MQKTTSNQFFLVGAYASLRLSRLLNVVDTLSEVKEDDLYNSFFGLWNNCNDKFTQNE